MLRLSCFVALVVVNCVGTLTAAEPAGDLPQAAEKAFHKAVAFFHGKVAKHGGYVYLYSHDLAKSEGEGKTGPDTIWVQPPGTPAVGSAFVEAYRRTGDPACLAAAKAAGEALIRGQYRSGGWNGSIEFDPALRAKTAYRVDQPLPNKRQFNVSTFDDDKTPAALRCLMQLDQTLEFKDARVHEAAQFALDSVLKVQFPNGAWAQGFEAIPDPAKYPVLKASYPSDWPRKYPGGDYWWFYTFNDNNISRTIETLLLAEDIYRDPRYRAAALKAGDFILLAQMPEPQPAWAQQYNFEMHPVWARKFEPASVSGGESQQLIDTLMDLYIETSDRKYLEPIPRALAYLKRSQLPDGQLARFYELQTNKPLYFVRNTYELTYSDADLPTHYGFQVGSKVAQLQRRYDQVSGWSADKVRAEREKTPGVDQSSSLEKRVRDIVAAQDDRGAWVQNGKLQHHGKGDDTTRIISSATFIRNLDTLSRYLAAVKAR